MRRSPILCLAASAGLLMIPVAAQASPLEVDDLDAAESAELAVTTAVESSPSETTIEGPILEIALPIAEGVEFSASAGRGHSFLSGAPNSNGWLDTEIGFKAELLPVGEQGGVGITLAPSATLPTGTNGLGAREWQADLPVIVGLVKGPYQLRGLIGITHSFAANESEFSFGIAAEAEALPGFILGAEIAGGMDGLFADPNAVNANLGATLALGERLELRGRAGHSLRKADGENVVGGLLTLQVSF